MYQTLIFWQDVVNSKDVRRLREPWKIRLHRAWPSLILHRNLSELQIPVEFRFGRNRDFLTLLSFPSVRGPREVKRFNASWRLISPANFHTSSDNRERNMQKWNSNNRDYVRKKPLRHGCDWRDQRRSWGSFAKHNVPGNVHCNDTF